MTSVLGVDGARGGWVAARVEGESVTWLRLRDVRSALDLGADAIAVDIPIGLPREGRRECDLLAKRRLGRAHSRVFLTPPRAVLGAADHAAAGAVHRRLVDGAGISIQTWHIVARICEVDEIADDPRVVEVHPELSFAALAGRVLAPKRTATGRAERVAALRSWLPGAFDIAELPGGRDAVDALDALAAAWSARRWLTGHATCLPAAPPLDERGRPMRIVT